MATQAERDAQSVANRELARQRRRANAPRQLALGDDVLILHHTGKGTTGTVTRINVPVPWGTGPTGVMVARHDGSGSGIYDRRDLALVD